MNFFDRLKAQVNMNDGGKTFSNPEPLRGPVQQGPGLRQVGGTQDASLIPSGMKLGTFRPEQPMNLTKQMGGMTFANRDGRQYEDESLVDGPQGFGPINSDIANFGNASMQPNMQPQFEDAYTPDLALNETYTQGNPQITRPGYSIQRGGNPQEDLLRKLLGY